MKCRTKLDDNKLIKDEVVVKDFLKKHYLKFFIKIMQTTSQSNDLGNLMIDVQLYKGTTLVFLSFTSAFQKKIQSFLKNVSL